ncbi:MAG: ATP-binding cassette domain-containing protein [Alphaproteobacteria bacterium]|nr:ATP-binding cassette domain-containing protein [Alphaproteobacteria bacterium]
MLRGEALMGGSQAGLIWRLLKYAVRQRPSILPITLFGILSSIAELVAVMSIIPLGIVASGTALSPQSLWYKLPAMIGLAPNAKFFVVFFLATLLFRMLTNTGYMALIAYTTQTLFAHLSARAHAAFVRHLTFTEIVKHQIGHFFTLAGDEANRGAQIVVGTMRIVPVIFLFATYAAFLFHQSWKAGLTLVGLLFVMAYVLKGAFRRTLVLGQRQQEESRATHTLFFDSLGGLRTVRGFTAENFVIQRYTKLISDYVRTTFLTEVFSQLTQAPAMIVIALVLAVVTMYADNAALLQNMPLFFAGVMIFTRMMPIANYGLDAAMKLTANLKAGRNVEEMLQAVCEAEDAETLPAFSRSERIESITFENLSFRYSDDTPPILENFSYTLKAGSSYAITGPSGAGKSSLVDLLLKFYEPHAGHIRVNGRDIAQLSAESLRQRIVLAEQATRIFYGSVLENVRFDDRQHRAEAEQALQLVGLAELLGTLPQGMDTVLAFQGANFSGGQRQRIGIARALVRTSDVLILDESTNALDYETRKRILDTLLETYHDRIVIFVTHDPYVIERADAVIELTPARQAATGAAAGAAQ